MRKHPNERNAGILWGLVLLAGVIGIIFRIWPLITGIPELDGLLAVCIGFYICARAAANFLNLILFELEGRHWISLVRSDLSWLALNSLVMFSGLMLVIIGIYRYFIRAF